MLRNRVLGASLAALLVAAACGADDTDGSGDAADGRPTIVVTTNILGDVVTEMVDGQAKVVTLMPINADPHDFALSAQQAVELRDASLVISNGAGFEEGMVDVLEAAEDDGVSVIPAIDFVEPLEGDHDHDEEHSDEGEHDHEGGVDPHFFTDPARMASAVRAMVDPIGEALPALGDDGFRSAADDFAAELDTLDAEVEEILASVPEDNRKLVTNHEVFAYFADRYDFEVLGTVLPADTTGAGANAQDLAALSEQVEDTDVPAIFVDTSSPDDVAQALAAEVDREVEVIELFSESLGDEDSDGSSYVTMVRTNAERIAGGLGG